MSNVTKIEKPLSVREQAEAEVRKELAEKAKDKMKVLLRQRAGAVAVVNSIDLQIADLEQQIADGTV
jgi:hypothetical protein